MEIDEFEQRLHDAEVRLARLKALYEQWFQGIERTEPAIARKEFERALEALKREQPRNTALRFRCQQLSARYGTYGIYWGRIAKQIEDGTYKRDVQRARAKAEKQKAREAQTFELDVEIDAVEDGLEGLGGFDDSDLDAILGALSSSPEISSAPSHTTQAPKTFGRVREPERPSPARATEPAPPPESAPATQPAPPPTATAARPGAPAPPRIPGASPPGKPAATVAPPAIPGARPPAPGAAGPTAATRVPPPPTKAPPPFEAPPPSSGAIAIGRMVRPATPAAGIREEAGAHSRSSRPVDGPASAVMPTAAGAVGGARPPAGVRPASPAGARPAPTSAAAPRPLGSPAARPAPTGNGGPDIQALYQRYVDARRQNNERVDNVRLESLQQSVEKMMPKLREKHGNKAIDFEVVLQDGKVGLKPKVRG